MTLFDAAKEEKSRIDGTLSAFGFIVRIFQGKVREHTKRATYGCGRGVMMAVPRIRKPSRRWREIIKSNTAILEEKYAEPLK